MAILNFDNFKYDNTSAAIPATNWGVFTSVGANFANTFAKNGYSSSGLDISVTTSGAVSHGASYVAKSNITTNNTNGNLIVAQNMGGRLATGFGVSQYPQSGGITIEPQLTSDMTPFIATNTSVAYNGDGSHMFIARTTSTSLVVDLWIRTVGTNTYTFFSNLTTVSTANITSFKLRFSYDGLYCLFVYGVPGANTSNVVVYRRATPTSNTYGQPFTTTAIAGLVNSIAWTPGGSFVIGTTLTPFMHFYFKTIGTDSWTKTTNPSTLPASGVNNVACDGATTVVGVCSGGSQVYLYGFSSSGAPSYVSVPLTGLNAPFGFDMVGSLFVIGTSTAPFIKVFSGFAGATLSFPDTLTQQPTVIRINPEGTMFTLGYATDGVPSATYKFSGNPLSIVKVTTPTALPALQIKDIQFSADNNYMALTSNSTGQGIYTYDNQVNVIATISPGMVEGSTSVDNYAYSGGASRFSITVQDEFLGLRYYSSATGGVYPFSSALSARKVGFTDNNFTNAYIEFYLNNLNSSSNITQASLYLNGTSLTGQISTPTTSSTIPVNEFSTFLNGNVSLSFKRDINTTTATTLNCVISDFYVLDGTGPVNNSPLGMCSVIQEPLVSDNSKQWTSTGPNSFSVLSNNPPNSAAFVSTNALGATDIINLDNSVNSGAFASKIALKAKVSTPTNLAGISLIDGNTYVLNTRLTPTFKEYTYASDLHSTYVASAYSTGSPLAVNKISPKSAAPTLLTIVGAAASGGNVTAMLPDASSVALGLTVAPFLQVFTRNADVYTASAQTFPDITTSVGLLEYSNDGKYLLVRQATSTAATIYSIVGGVYTKLTDLVTTASAASAKFSKGGKYLFLGFNGAAQHKTYSINTSTNTFTSITNLTAAAVSAIDTSIDVTGTVEHVILGLQTAPWMVMSKINNDDTFTAVTVTTQTLFGQAVQSLSITPMLNPTSSTFVSIVQNTGGTNASLTAAFTPTTNTLGNASLASVAPSSVTKIAKAPTRTAFIVYAIISSNNLSYAYLGANGSNSATNGGFVLYNTTNALVSSSLSIAEVVENYNTVGYTYTT